MNSALVLTVIGPDRPGLVEAISDAVASHEGNWEESRMARLSGQFAGILRVSVPPANAAALEQALNRLSDRGLSITLVKSQDAEPTGSVRRVRLELVGQDHPGIVRDISRVIASHEVNVEKLSTECSSAAMAGGALFKASAELTVPETASLDALQAQLEDLAHDLMVDVQLD